MRMGTLKKHLKRWASGCPALQPYIWNEAGHRGKGTPSAAEWHSYLQATVDINGLEFPQVPVMLLARTAMLVPLRTEKLNPPVLRDVLSSASQPRSRAPANEAAHGCTATFDPSVFAIHVSAFLSTNC